MSEERYLVTGGAGFIGSHIARELVARGERVRVLDDFSSGKEENLTDALDHVELIRGDIRDSRTVHAAVEGVSVIFHEAAIASVQRSLDDPEMTLDVNVKGMNLVLEAARKHGARRVVIASSSAIYGDTPTFPLNESMPPRPLSPYAAHKLSDEYLCTVYQRLYGLETVALRYFNVFGPGQDPNSDYGAVIPRFVTRLRAGQRPIVFGDGEQTRDFIHVSDIVRANLIAASSANAAGGVFNIGGGQRISLNQVLAIASETLGAPADADYQPPREGDIRDSVADITRARDVLGFSPQISFRDGLASLLRTPAK
ncbi:MAG TPA: SDR family oxidoreductase [Ktedonobacterales bacterium]